MLSSGDDRADFNSRWGAQRALNRTASTLLLATVAPAALAHGFGQRVDLSLPMWLWLLGSALTLLLAFAATIDFLPQRLQTRDYPHVSIVGPVRTLPFGYRVLIFALRALGLGALGLTVYLGFFVPRDSSALLAPSLVWIVFWIGLGLTTTLVGNIWSLVNPLRTLFKVYEWAFRRRVQRPPAPLLPYPPRLSYWPAVAGLLLFSFAEHLWTGADEPAALATGIVVYVTYSFAAMCVFGAGDWLRHGDPFSVLFELIARVAPLEYQRGEYAEFDERETTPATSKALIRVRPPASGLLNPFVGGVALLMFVCIALASVSFDGLLETTKVRELLRTPADSTTFGFANPELSTSALLAASGSLLVLPIVYLLIFVACCRLAVTIAPSLVDRTSTVRPSLQVASAFIVGLLPTGIAYHIAHYLGALLDAPRTLIPPLMETFGGEWNRFGIAHWFRKSEYIGGDALWNIAVAAVIVGHILSAYLIHVIALERTASRREAVRAEIPIVLGLLAYTVLSSWILAEPLFD